MKPNQQVFVASEVEISELKQNDIFLEIDLCLCSTRPNKNRESVTEAFIDEIVANLDTYDCLPLYCDVDRLLAGQYDKLTHMQNRSTGTFGTTQIGSLRGFRKEKDGQVSRLIATARIPKREADICYHLANMYEQDILCFSFEVAYVLADTVVEQGTRFVDASDRNFIFGMTVVSKPAYEESVSLRLVAEDATAEATKETEDGETPLMDQIEKKDLEAVETVAEQTEETVEATEEVTQETVAESNETADSENVETVAEETEASAETVETEEAEVETVAEETAEVEEPSVETVAESESDKEDDPEEEAKDEEDTPDNDNEDGKKEAVATVFDCATMPEMTLQDCPCVDPNLPAPPSPQDMEIDAAHAQIDAEMARLRAVIAQYEAELEVLRAEHLELEAIRAAQKAKELQMRQDQARAFAQHEGLSIEDTAVAEAINEVDYEKLVSISMGKNAHSDMTASEEIVLPAINVVADVKLTDNRGWLFEKS